MFKINVMMPALDKYVIIFSHSSIQIDIKTTIKSIKEIFRVLKSYGTLVILETAVPQNKILKYL